MLYNSHKDGMRVSECFSAAGWPGSSWINGRCCCWAFCFSADTIWNLHLLLKVLSSYKQTSVLWQCWLGGRKGIRPVKMGWWWRWALVSPDGVVPSWMVSVSASVNVPLCHKVQNFSSGTGSPGWSRKKGRKTVVWCGVVAINGLKLSVPFWSRLQTKLFCVAYKSNLIGHRHKGRLFCSQLVMYCKPVLVDRWMAPRGPGAPRFPLFSLVHSLPHLLLFFYFSPFPFLTRFTYFLLLWIPSPFLPEESHSVSRPEVVGGDQTWVCVYFVLSVLYLV